MSARLQLSRQKGFRLPDDAVSVARPSRFGNPFAFDELGFVYSPGGNWWGCWTEEAARSFAVELFDMLLSNGAGGPAGPINYPMRGELQMLDNIRERILNDLDMLRGKRLACWCPVDRPCHADVLLRALEWEAAV